MFGGRRHQQQQPCWNKMIPWLFKTIHKEQIIIKKTKIYNEKKKMEENCPMALLFESYLSTST